MRHPSRTRSRAIRASFLTWIVVLTLATTSAGKDSDSIVLVHEAGQEVLTTRLRDELYALGWLVVEIPRNGRGEPLDVLAERVHAFAGVQVGHGELEVWIAPARRPAFRERLRVDTADAEVAALRAVEVLRTRFLELGLTPPAEAAQASVDESKAAPNSRASRSTAAPASEPLAHPAAAPASLKPRPKPARPAIPAVWLGVGPAASASVGGVGPYPAVFVEFRIRAASRWSFGGDVVTPLVTPTVESSRGSADIRPTVLEARAAYSLLPERSFVDVAVTAGLGAALVQMDGKAAKPYGGRSDAVVALALSTGAVVSLRLSDRWSLLVGLAGGVATPRPVVRFAGDTVATWGQPFGMATLGVEVGIGQ